MALSIVGVRRGLDAASDHETKARLKYFRIHQRIHAAEPTKLQPEGHCTLESHFA
jgi:hypothetical protein